MKKNVTVYLIINNAFNRSTYWFYISFDANVWSKIQCFPGFNTKMVITILRISICLLYIHPKTKFQAIFMRIYRYVPNLKTLIYEPPMGKPSVCIGENKDVDQLRGNHEADQRLCFRYTDRTIPLNFPTPAIFCACTALFVSDLFGNHIVGFSTRCLLCLTLFQ